MNGHEFIAAFERCEVEEFHHADHVRLAWSYLRELPLLAAIERFTAALKRFAAHNNASGLYHETITWAYLLLIHERMNGEESFEAFRMANGDLFRWKPSVIDSMYHPETLRSEKAKRTFLLPDACRPAPPSL